MRIEVLGCYGGESPQCRLTGLLVEGTTALDAGCLSKALAIERQMQVRAVVLTHSHMDHTAALPFLVDNIFSRGDGLDVHGSEATIHAVRRHLFNSATWPDFTRLPNHLVPAMRFQGFETEVAFRIGNVTFTPIEVNHVVPTHGFLLEQGDAAVLWSSDTGPTERLWEIANRTPHLKAVCIDVSFDNARQQVADDSGHLSPRSLERELEKLQRDVPVLIHHMKPSCIEPIRREVAAIRGRSLGFLEQDRVYDF